MAGGSQAQPAFSKLQINSRSAELVPKRRSSLVPWAVGDKMPGLKVGWEAGDGRAFQKCVLSDAVAAQQRAVCWDRCNSFDGLTFYKPSVSEWEFKGCRPLSQWGWTAALRPGGCKSQRTLRRSTARRTWQGTRTGPLAPGLKRAHQRTPLRRVCVVFIVSSKKDAPKQILTFSEQAHLSLSEPNKSAH